ncbi:iron export ABC transporter permease subunit FetB [Streptomyces ruber]|uniref:Iron export ABC transporter permease subunit FetB n=2 Tax=Streptomyces TaxID=1883 RepID=A0A918BN49_9ACTN|nr:iron export ABC transporter permease subunit FetB [Streptomyces ruber]GGQ75698.1 iron export ABC transporter permease subunit FetB [Streptomyces ruber]
MSPAVPSWPGVAASAALVVLTVVVARRGRLGLTRDITVAALRAALQLTAVGAVLLLVFRHTGLAGALGWLALMVLVAGRMAARRTGALPGTFRTATAAIAVGTTASMGVLLVLGIIATQPRVVIPVGGMVVAGAMGATDLALIRLYDEVRTARPAIEARLSLGLAAGDAFAPHRCVIVRTALLPVLDSARTLGVIALPGAMTGLILAGVDPLTAIRYQIVVTYMLLAAACLAAVVAVRLSERALFDDAHRLRPLPGRRPSS